MSERKLKIWNGNVQSIVPHNEALRNGLRHNSYVHAYACATSRADLCRMLVEWAGGQHRSLDSYIRDYWHEGAWGNAMTGVTPERGIWVAYAYGSKPERIWPRDES